MQNNSKSLNDLTQKEKNMSKHGEKVNRLKEVKGGSSGNDNNKNMEEKMMQKSKIEEAGMVVDDLRSVAASGNYLEAQTIAGVWLSQFKTAINVKYCNKKFDSHILRLMDEHRDPKHKGIYNTARRLAARNSLAHLRVEAKPNDEYDPSLLAEIVTAYQSYHKIIEVVEKFYQQSLPRSPLLGSTIFFSFVVRDFLTEITSRVIQEDPVTAALKMIDYGYEIPTRFGAWDIRKRQDGISYIRNLMAAKVRSYLAVWCHEAFPADAQRCGLPKEPVMDESCDGEFEKVFSLEIIDCSVVNTSSCIDLLALKSMMDFVEFLIENNHVFCFPEKKNIDGWYVFCQTKSGSYYYQDIDYIINYHEFDEIVVLDNNDTLDALFDTGMIPIMIENWNPLLARHDI
jgi:hypothetical protein